MHEQRRAALEPVRRKRPPRLGDRPEECREREAPREEGDRVARPRPPLRDEDVERVAEACDAGDCDADAVEAPTPELHDQHQPGEAQRQGDPDPRAHPLVPGEPRPDGDEDRRKVLDQQRFADRQTVDREEIRPLNQCEPADPERREQDELTARHANRVASRREHDQREADEGSSRSHLRQSLCVEAGVLDDLDDGRVDGEQHRRDGDHRVPGGRAVRHSRRSYRTRGSRSRAQT